MAMVRVKGSKITSKLAFIDQQYGPARRADVIAAVSTADREALRLVLEVGWYPQELYARLLSAMGQVLAPGDPQLYARIGHYTAEHQFSHSYKSYRASEVAEMLHNMVPVHSMLNDPGAMSVSMEGPGRATIVVSQPPSTSTICAVSRAFYQRAFELQGAREVSVQEPECTGPGQAACRFEIRWTES